MSRKITSMLIIFAMIFTAIPLTISASEPDTVYISISDDSQFVTDSNGTPMAFYPVTLDELTAVDLDVYGLGDYLYDADDDGIYEITALHLYIYVHEAILGFDWSDVYITGSAGSIYFAGGLFGFSDENLRYDLNGAYPAVDGWGLTADRIVLNNGDFLNIAHYTSWAFWGDSTTGFHYFTDSQGNLNHTYNTSVNEELELGLVRSYSDWANGGAAAFDPEIGYTVYYGTAYGVPTGSTATDDNGLVNISFPSRGTWYVWTDGGYGMENPEDIVSAPAFSTVKIKAKTDSSYTNIDHKAIYEATGAYISALGTPSVGSTGGEWMVIDLTRSGYDCPEGYYENVVNYVKENINDKEQLHRAKSTDNSRVILALTSAGYDVTDVDGHNLLMGLTDMTYLKKQGINGPIWALIAFDCHGYEIPVNAAATEQATREKIIAYILEKQFEDGGWALSGKVADPDMTGMAIQSLAPYYETNAEVKAAIDKAIVCLSEKQYDNGGFGSIDGICSESCAQVIVALTALGINPETDPRFVKNGVSVVDAMCLFAVEGGGFAHIPDAGINGMATEQAQYALASYFRFLDGKTSLYDMSDVDIYTKDEKAAGAVEAMISAIGTVTAESKDAIEEARAAYDALTDEQKALVENHGVLIQAETDFNELINEKDISFFEKLINWFIKAFDWIISFAKGIFSF